MEDAGLARKRGRCQELAFHTNHSRPFLGLCEDVEVGVGGLKTTHPMFGVEHGDHDLDWDSRFRTQSFLAKIIGWAVSARRSYKPCAWAMGNLLERRIKFLERIYPRSPTHPPRLRLCGSIDYRFYGWSSSLNHGIARSHDSVQRFGL